jgi:hypothetical protein
VFIRALMRSRPKLCRVFSYAFSGLPKPKISLIFIAFRVFLMYNIIISQGTKLMESIKSRFDFIDSITEKCYKIIIG